ncbi:hypothetical protein IW492_11465 [Enterococcus sp. BWB1-3]|uniref:hypothetical protein n=1 Tax=Enterococcus sp. BWB1-3 TaxID=2787713 RepID=UPI0019245129|nr:hypothetical protein [Enterococcus sp. BWB1-3]MBL1229850.1 hypothetical protein [Enterococcus sp. BWB1-3]
MDFELYFNTLLDYDDFVEIVTITFSKFEIPLRKSSDEDGVYLSYNYFTITIFKEVYGIDGIEDEFGMRVNRSISIELLSKQASQGIKLLFQVINTLLQQINGDVIFLGDSSKLIFKKENEYIFAYDNSEEYFFSMPFDELDKDFSIEYKK